MDPDCLMLFRLTLPLLALLAGIPVHAQGIVQDTGPRYCPELAETENPFRVVCPSWDTGAFSGVAGQHNLAQTGTHPAGVLVSIGVAGQSLNGAPIIRPVPRPQLR